MPHPHYGLPQMQTRVQALPNCCDEYFLETFVAEV